MEWQRALERSWSDLRLGEVKVTSGNGRDAFEVQVLLGRLDSNSLRVEIYAEGPKEGGQLEREMIRGRQLVGAKGFMYSAQVP